MSALQWLHQDALHTLTPSILGQLGQRFGIDYRFDAGQAHAPVATGRVQHARLDCALHLTLSDLQVARRYTSCSQRAAPWLISVVLDGHIHAAMGEHTATLAAGEGVCAHLTPQAPLIVTQPAQPRLLTVTLAVMAPGLLSLAPPPPDGVFHAFSLPKALTDALLHWLETPLAAWRETLVWQGLALQLLGVGIPETPPCGRIAPRDRERLEALRERLARSPVEPYTLTALAADVAMSPSSLRHKFRACYGCSVFDYLRHCRMELAYRHLQQGKSVQHTAHACGYRHATNFATAFRRTFGCAPHDILAA